MASPALAPTGQTGPRTPEGKAASSQNSTTHGLSSARVVLAHEDQAAFLQLAASLHADLGTTGAHETFLALGSHEPILPQYDVVRAMEFC